MRRLAVLGLFLAGCGRLGSAVQVTVTSDGVVQGVELLRATVSNNQMAALPVVFSPVGAPVDISTSSPQRFTLLFDAERSGEADIKVEAVAGGMVLTSTVGSVALVPGRLLMLTITLHGMQVGNDLGADGGPDLAMLDAMVRDDAMPDLAAADLAMPDLAMPDLAMPDLAPPVLSYNGSTHTAAECIVSGGTVAAVMGDSNGTQVCRFKQNACPAGWATSPWRAWAQQGPLSSNGAGCSTTFAMAPPCQVISCYYHNGCGQCMNCGLVPAVPWGLNAAPISCAWTACSNACDNVNDCNASQGQPFPAGGPSTNTMKSEIGCY